MNIANIRDWFKTIVPGFTTDGYFLGRLQNTTRENLISFRRGATTSQQKAIGGMANTSYSRIACNCIVHLFKDAKASEVKIEAIRETLLNVAHPIINGHDVVMLTIRNLVDIGVDANGIQEYALDFEIMYQR